MSGHTCIQAGDLESCIFREHLTGDHISLADMWATHPVLSQVLCFQKLEQMEVSQSYKHVGLKPRDNQTHVRWLGDILLLSLGSE